VLVGSMALDRSAVVRPNPITTSERANRTLLVGLTLTGAALTLVPLEIYTVGHFNRIMPSHLWANSGLIRGDWLDERLHLAARWLLPSSWRLSGPVHPETFWTAAPLILLAAVPARADAS